MKIVCLKGGLGNQLFEYCRYRQLQENATGKVYLYRDFRKLKQHGGTLVSHCFDIQLPPQQLWVTLLVLTVKFLRVLHLCPMLYDETDRRCILIDSYSQDRHYISQWPQLLKFRDIKMTVGSSDYLSQIKASPYPVAVHIRRGDYLQADNLENIGICDISYYRQAIDTVRQKHRASQFFFFSDDMAWVRQHLFVENAVYVEHDNTNKDVVDLYLMALCKAHVIANSTYSFWGSMLAESEEHLCIYPKHWFANPQWTVPDIFPSHWISL